jgi:bacterioferritin
MNYLAHSANLDGIKAEEIREILSEEVNDEISHAEQLANRIKELGGTVDGSKKFKPEQESGQPPADTTDIATVVKGVVEAEKDAIQQYQKIIQMTDGVDHVTQDLCVELQTDEEKHLRIFKGFKKELDKSS